MAQQTVGFKDIHLFKDQILGIGSYGKVCKAKCDDLTCAAKLIHETLFDPNAHLLLPPQKEHKLPIRRFEQECEFLSTIRHPNIVQYLGVYQDPDTGLPVLLMELMDGSLTLFLENSPDAIPYHVQVNLCHDIALALSYLHSNGIIHRDLSSNNVLLIGDIRAKVTDFGMARLGGQTLHATRLNFTMCPGTDVYMPPEAVQDNPVYTKKIDCFAFGVITLQILTRKFPNPGDRRKKIEIAIPGSATGSIVEVLIPETERRQSHISEVNPNRDLLKVVLDCLKDEEGERPSAGQLCERVASLKTTTEYDESVQSALRNRDRTNQERCNAESAQYLEQSVQSQKRLLKEKETITKQREALRKKDEIIAAARQLQAPKQLNFDERETELMSLGQWKPQKKKKNPKGDIFRFRKQPANETSASKQQRQSSGKAITNMMWRERGKAARKMSTKYNTVTDSTSLYVRIDGMKVYSYTASSSTWSQLPDGPTNACPLVIVNNLLTLVGGCQGSVATNELFSLTTAGDGDRKWSAWTTEFPPMPTGRYGSTALCNKTDLIVAGGLSSPKTKLKIVEVMNTETFQWSTAVDLPQPLSCAPSAVCGDQIYVLSLRGASKLTYTCSMSTLKSSHATASTTLWSSVAAPPLSSTTCVSLNGHLLAIGGCSILSNTPTAAVYVYDPNMDSWKVISHMTRPRSECFAAAFPDNHLTVVGGWSDDEGKTDSMEVATVEFS